MTKRMLIDAIHEEETRVALVDGNKLVEYDFEAQSRAQLKGNIYLARITRVEPSLQAAFVEYGGNRHGFLAFSEIHPDYYRIPMADREALLDDEELDENIDGEPAEVIIDEDADEDGEEEAVEAVAEDGDDVVAEEAEAEAEADPSADDAAEEAPEGTAEADSADDDASEDDAEEDAENKGGEIALDVDTDPDDVISADADAEAADAHDEGSEDDAEEEAAEEDPEVKDREQKRRRTQRLLKKYKIQEVVKRRQIMLVQVAKEERGSKGAALTTYLSLAGRYCVLMPNSPRGGGVSRKITNHKDRKRMKELISSLDVPEGMSVILRTAGVERTKAEIKRDLDYLLRQWDNIRALTLKSQAPALIYEEGDLIKRTMRDMYTRDVDEVLIAGEEGHKSAKEFMKMLMPSHARRIKQYKEEDLPVFSRYQVETQINDIHEPVVQLKSGGYLVINPTEALVSIDINSGRATKERHIEETALRTNLEAAAEIARQVRLRDLAGLVVIDFIDMEENRNNNAVERKLKESMRGDRARIQLGRISMFGLLEFSRQRLRPSLIETAFEPCVYSQGTGYQRTVESSALQALRMLQEEAVRNKGESLEVTVETKVALYLLNNKRRQLIEIEDRYGISVAVLADDELIRPECKIERAKNTDEGRRRHQPVSASRSNAAFDDEADEDGEDGGRRGRGRRGRGRGRDRGRDRDGDRNRDRDQDEDRRETSDEDGEEGGRRRRRRRRRGRGRRDDADTGDVANENALPEDADGEETESDGADESRDDEGRDDEDRGGRRRRRGRRGGRRRGGRGQSDRDDNQSDEGSSEEVADGEPADAVAAEPSSDEPVAAPSEDAAPEEAKEEKPKRSRSRRKPKAEAAADAPAEEAASEPAPVEAEKPAEPVEEKAEKPKKKAAPKKREPGPGENLVLVGDGGEEKAEKAEKPRRGGWWRRKESADG